MKNKNNVNTYSELINNLFSNIIQKNKIYNYLTYL